MPSPEARSRKPAPLFALVKRDMRALFASTSPFVAFLLAGPLAGIALRGASLSSSDTLAGVVAPTLTALAATTSFLFPFIVARAFAVDRHNGASALLAALGHRPIAIAIAQSIACALAFALLALPAVTTLFAFSLGGGHVHVASLACALLGHALWAAVVVGIGAVCAAFTTSASAAALATLAITVALACFPLIGAADEAATSSWTLLASASSSLAPSSLLAPFESGVIDARITLTLAVVASAMVFAGAFVGASSSPPEKKAARTAAVMAACVIVVALGSQVRASVDVSEGHRHSFPKAIVEAMHKIGDPVHVVVRLRGNDPHFAELKRDVLGPLSRAAVVDVERVDTDDRKYGLVTYQVGTRASDSRSLRPDEVAPLVLDLAGVRAPPFIDDEPPHASTYFGKAPLALAVAFAVWPFVAVLLLARSRRTQR